LAPAVPGLAWPAGLFAAGLLAWPWVALSLGLGFDPELGFGLELRRRPPGSTTVVASTVTAEPPRDSGLGLELGAGTLAGGALVVAGGALVVAGGAGVLDVFAGGELPVTPSGAADLPEGVSAEPDAGAGGGELPVEVVEPGSPAASAPGEIGASPDRVKPPPARAESSARHAHRRGRLSGAMRRARSSWDAPIVALCALLALRTGFAHCIAYRQPIRRG
jgi:hypothetical protein